MDATDSNIIDLPPSLRKRFYESVVFLYTFRNLLKKQTDGTKAPDLESITDKSPQATFFCFVNKLALVCHSRRGRDTITAFAVLQTGPIEYWFASNNRTAQELEDVRRYVTTLLNTLGQSEDDEVQDASLQEDSPLFANLMGQVLEFNRPHIVETHIEYQLIRNIDFCIDACNKEASQPDALFVANQLQSLKTLAEPSLEPGLDNAQFIQHTRQLLLSISTSYHLPRFKQYLSSQTRQDREDSNHTPWTQLYHGIGRLQAYTLAVKTFLSVRLRWRDLFESFEIIPIPSSEPSADPPSIRRSSSGIITRLSKDPSVQSVINSKPSLITQLDKGISEAIKRKHFLPIVHAEVLLAEHILGAERGDSGDHHIRFFNEAVFGRYIGCSKPTCRLCELYFQAPRTFTQELPIKVRPGHHNFYHAWKVPDVLVGEEKQAERRNRVLEWMVATIKDEAVRTVLRGFAVRSSHDSNTYPSSPFSNDGGSMVGGGGFGDLEGLERRMRLMG
ncbi:hypothetical protein QBC38DRAFT_393576, partial [Podospora fimiseda]